MTYHRPLFVVLACLTLTAAAADAAPANRGPGRMGGDPTDGRDPLDDALAPLVELNMRPDFELTRTQKEQIRAIRDGYDARLSAWRDAHAGDFKTMVRRWQAMQPGTQPAAGGGGGGGGGIEGFAKLMRAGQELLATSPDATAATDQVMAVLTADQRQRVEAAINHDGVDAARPAAPFGADVLPLPPDGVPKAPGFYKLRFNGQVAIDHGQRSVRMTYVLFLPKSYKPDGGPYPTLVFLHGSGEAGTDGNGVMIPGLGVAGDIRSRAGTQFANEFPMIVISPQCPPRGERWDDEPMLRGVLGILDEAGKKVRVDPDRVYATGLSMGGKGTWLLAGLDPDRFAAIAPLASSTLDEGLARRLRFESIWTVNGSDDIEDGATNEPRMAQAARDAGGDAKATILAGRDHGVWDDYYRDPAFYQWFLGHRRLTPAERAAREATTRPATTGPAGVPG